MYYVHVQTDVDTAATNQKSETDSRQILRHQYGISVIEEQKSLLWNVQLAGENDGRWL